MPLKLATMVVAAAAVARKFKTLLPFLAVFIHLGVMLVAARARNCDPKSLSQLFSCHGNSNREKCKTYAILRPNSCRYLSISNLGYHLNIPSSELARVNKISPGAPFFPTGRSILIPLGCECGKSDPVFEGGSFFEIVESFEGLTNCDSVKEENPCFLLSDNGERSNLLAIPLKCACPDSSAGSNETSHLLLSYPVEEGDGLAREILVSAHEKYSNLLAIPLKCACPDSSAGSNETSHLLLSYPVEEGDELAREILVSAHEKYSKSVRSPFSTLLLPLQSKPVPDPAPNPQVEPAKKPHDGEKHDMVGIGIYIAIAVVAVLVGAAIFAAVFFLHIRKRKSEEPTSKNVDLELQRLGLSIRTTSDKKISFESSQQNFDEPRPDTTTPHRTALFETYALEDLDRATESFSPSNLIGGSVFYGRLKGRDLAVKRVGSDLIPDIDHHMLDERPHQTLPNTIRLLGTCPAVDGSQDSFVVLEFAENGSLKDWIHGGLAIKSHFIESCSCFLTWNQRLRICLDVATALQYMHHVMRPSFVHGSISSRNIFLDGDFGAKVGNPVLSRCIESKEEEEDGEASSQCQISKKGYLAPECLSKSTMSPATDVFAYGVVLLEVLSGKPPVGGEGEGKDGVLIKLSDEIKRVLGSDGEDELRGWVDSNLGENYSFDVAFMLAGLAKSCVDDDVALRPSAGEIVEKLLRLVEDLPEGDGFNACESSCKPTCENGREIDLKL